MALRDFKNIHMWAPISSVDRAGIPCAEALSSLQWPRVQVRSVALCFGCCTGSNENKEVLSSSTTEYVFVSITNMLLCCAVLEKA